MRTFFGITAVFTLFLGVAWVFFPGAMLDSWSVRPDPATIYMSQRYGGLFFGYAVILLVSRAAGSSPARTAILAGGAVVTGVLGIISCVGVLTGVVGPFVWSAVVVEGILAAGFLYFLFTSR
jgi:hypothetical protein